jgi:hypothetical protein
MISSVIYLSDLVQLPSASNNIQWTIKCICEDMNYDMDFRIESAMQHHSDLKHSLACMRMDNQELQISGLEINPLIRQAGSDCQFGFDLLLCGSSLDINYNAKNTATVSP